MKKQTTAERLNHALAEIETLKAQVAVLQAWVALMGQPAVLPYRPFVPHTQPTWPPIAPKPPYEVFYSTAAAPHVPTGFTVQKVDAMRLCRGAS